MEMTRQRKGESHFMQSNQYRQELKRQETEHVLKIAKNVCVQSASDGI